MTSEDIAKTLRSVCIYEPWANDFWAITPKELERFVARVEAAKEQEMLAEGWVLDFPPPQEADQ
jgi:hypothetical protein